MSRITKYLKQSCQLSPSGRSTLLKEEHGNNVTFGEIRIILNNDAVGDTTMNKYGELQYAPEITLMCRREPCTRDIQTANGAIVRSTDRYYLDARRIIHNDDLLDGKVILQINGLVDQFGKLVGYECYV